MTYKKSLLEQIEDSGKLRVAPDTKKEGDYEIEVKPFSIQFVMSCLNSHLGTNNYRMSYHPETVSWTIFFNVHAREELKQTQ